MTVLRTPSGPAAAAAGPTAPAARRAQPLGWRDPRLIAGVVIVAVCVLIGARVLAGADDTVAVWSLRHDVPAGTTVDPGDLSVTRVHFSGDGATRYLFSSSNSAPTGVATHDLARGELLPRSALTTDGRADLVEVPLSVAPDDLPASVREGALVDVWVTPKVADPGAEEVRARLALDDVVVVAVPAARDSLAPRTTQQVIVGVDEASATDLADALGQLADGRVVLTRQAGS
jgi:SAF domain-containing protein